MTESKKVCSSLIEDMNLGIRIFLRPGFFPDCLMLFLSAAERLQYPSDLRMHKAPENIFKLIGICFFTQLIDPVFNKCVNVKRIATGINDKASGIRAQIDQIPAPKIIRIRIRLSNKIAGFPVYFFLRQVQRKFPYKVCASMASLCLQAERWLSI